MVFRKYRNTGINTVEPDIIFSQNTQPLIFWNRVYIGLACLAKTS